MYWPTPLQEQIELIITNGRGYDRLEDTAFTQRRFLDKEVGLQLHLADMYYNDSNLSDGELLGVAAELTLTLDALVDKFDKAGIPLETITSAEGFAIAFDSAYKTKQSILADPAVQEYYDKKEEELLHSTLF